MQVMKPGQPCLGLQTIEIESKCALLVRFPSKGRPWLCARRVACGAHLAGEVRGEVSEHGLGRSAIGINGRSFYVRASQNVRLLLSSLRVPGVTILAWDTRNQLEGAL